MRGVITTTAIVDLASGIIEPMIWIISELYVPVALSSWLKAIDLRETYIWGSLLLQIICCHSSLLSSWLLSLLSPSELPSLLRWTWILIILVKWRRWHQRRIGIRCGKSGRAPLLEERHIHVLILIWFDLCEKLISEIIVTIKRRLISLPFIVLLIKFALTILMQLRNFRIRYYFL